MWDSYRKKVHVDESLMLGILLINNPHNNNEVIIKVFSSKGTSVLDEGSQR